MARVFVFSEFCSPTTPSIEEVAEMLPVGARIIASNINYNQIPHYWMVAFDKYDDTYLKWCDDKEKEIPIYLTVAGKWNLRS